MIYLLLVDDGIFYFTMMNDFNYDVILHTGRYLKFGLMKYIRIIFGKGFVSNRFGFINRLIFNGWRLNKDLISDVLKIGRKFVQIEFGR